MITRYFAFLALIAVIQGCGRSEVSVQPESVAADSTQGVAVRATCPATNAFDYYFPVGTIEASEPPSDLISRTRSYSKQLIAMGESSISCGEGDNSYRFIWLRSFHPAIGVRVDVDRNTQKATLRAVELESTGGYEPGAVARVAQRELTKSEVKKLLTDIREGGLWSLPTKSDGPPGADGATWIIEMRNNNRYHVIYRWSPESGPVYWRGLDLLQLTGWHIKDVY